MAKPVILAVDDDPQVLRAVERDLRRRYAREYRILRADSGESALDTLGKLKLRGDPVALFLVDQRMPRMTGVQFLEEAIERYPDAKRALLTAYSDTEAAIRAINEVGLDYYLQKPDHGTPELPLVVYEDGTYAEAPENREIAEKIGLQTRAEQQFYDLVIVGGGPSGLAAAVYGASEGLKTVLVEREAPGGQAGTSSRIENYLGFPKGLSGGDLARRAVDQARRFEVEILTPQEVAEVRVENPYRVVKLGDGTEISCHALLITTGVSYRKLEMPGIERLTGAGVYYGAAMTEALSCRDEDVYIVGGANSAGQAAMFFSQHARKVVILCRSGDLRKGMSEYLVKQIEDTPNIEVRVNSGVAEAFGEDHLERLTIKNSKTGEEETASARSLFIFIGAAPKTEWLDGVVERDERGFILSGPDLMHEGKRAKGWRPDRDPFLLETSVPGIFVAGDVRHGSVKRCASAVG